MKNLFNAALQLFKALLLFGIFWGLMVSLLWIWQSTPFTTTYYQKDDVPHRFFRVLVINENGFRQLETWEIAQKLPPNQWVVQIDENENCMERCLRQNPNGDWVLYNEFALAQTQSTYRIDGNRLVPVSFWIVSVVDMFAMMLLLVFLAMCGRYVWRCWQYRYSREKLWAYHRAIGVKLMRFLVFLGILVLLYVLGNRGQAA